jgi:hypothetical protein
METRTERESKGKPSKKHMPFQHRILSTARLGVVMVAGMVTPGPQRSMAWWVVIGRFYCWWLLEWERGSWGKSDGPAMGQRDTARESQTSISVVWESMFRIASPNSLNSSASPLLSSSLPSPLPSRFLLRNSHTFVLSDFCVNCYFF